MPTAHKCPVSSTCPVAARGSSVTLFVELLLTKEGAFRPLRSVSVPLTAVYAALGKISLNRPIFFKLWSSTGFLYANIFLKMNSLSPGERSWLTEAGGGAGTRRCEPSASATRPWRSPACGRSQSSLNQHPQCSTNTLRS